MALDNVSAIYEPMLFVGWIGQRPMDYELAWEPGAAVPDGWHEIVVNIMLTCGIKVSAELGGLTVYDFTDWPRGIVPPIPGFQTIGKISRASRPALVWRLRIVNSHLTLLHAAAMFQHNESPLVTRVNVFDLYRYDYPDASSDGRWYRWFGAALPNTVTSADRLRAGVMSATTFNLSLEWLQAVVVNDALIEFDLLNQAQVALSTHDYALTVVAGWTICELRIHSLMSQVFGKIPQNASEVIKVLHRHGLLSQAQVERLDDVRKCRNRWLHSGNEPAEAFAGNAIIIAAELLRTVVPDLIIRLPAGPLIL
jgi:hypothetical protein